MPQGRMTSMRSAYTFSPLSRDLFPKDYIDSYRGMVLLLMNTHVNWQVVTPRNLAASMGRFSSWIMCSVSVTKKSGF